MQSTTNTDIVILSNVIGLALRPKFTKHSYFVIHDLSSNKYLFYTRFTEFVWVCVICIIKKYATVVSSAFQVLDIVIDEAKNILERTSFVYFG